MGRAIVTKADVAAQQAGLALEGVAGGGGGGEVKEDQFLDRLVKYIPADVIAAYLAVEAGLANVPATQQLAASLVVFAIFFFGTWVWLRRLQVTRTSQIVISMIAFAVWVFATSGGPLVFVEHGRELARAYGPIVVPIFTFAAALFPQPEAAPSPAPAPTP